MLDIKRIRKNYQAIEESLRKKDPSIELLPIVELDEQVRKKIGELESARAHHKQLSNEVGGYKQKELSLPKSLLSEIETLTNTILRLEEERENLETSLNQKMAELPNIPEEGVPLSFDPAENLPLKIWKSKPLFDFPLKNHLELNEQLHLFDFKRASKTSGSGWPAYRHMGARLEWALINYMIHFHIRKGFELWMPPLAVRSTTLFGSAHLPKFQSQQFKIEGKELYLIPTAEAVLNGLHSEETFPIEKLPCKYIAYTPCFRQEAGAAGSQERGLIRTHQFNKVEMFAFATPQQSEKLFQEMVESAEQILEGLGLHYRTMLLVTGETSFAAMKTVDIEVWLPGQNRYYEVSSISNCGDFQSRRSKTYYRGEEEKREFVYTLNGSGLATSRLMVALLENNQTKEGSILLPPALHSYLDGTTRIDRVES